VNTQIKEIFAEDPNAEQWQMIMNFSYSDNIKNYFKKRNIEIDNKDFLETIAGSILQAKEYFDASNMVSLNTSPLLLYYGVTNLLFGVSCLLCAKPLNITNHGMKLSWPKDRAKRIADVEIVPFNPKSGALSQFCNIFCSGEIIPYGKNWTLLEIIGSIPDLKQDFDDFYSNARSYVIPVQDVKRKDDSLERIRIDEIKRFEEGEKILEIIESLDDCYLSPQSSGKYIILRKRIGGKDVGVFSLSGQKFLQIAHIKGSRCVTLPIIIYIYMGLFALGFLSRYHPDIWSVFIRSDFTGEKQLLSKFINISRRYLPNLLINFIYGMRMQFTNAVQGVLDLSQTIEEN